jgi:hypothetical protein
MNILQALTRLRDDIKTWCINNLNTKLNKNLGTVEKDKILIVNANGDIVTTNQKFIPAYTCSKDDDVEVGVTQIGTGTIHFVYEE